MPLSKERRREWEREYDKRRRLEQPEYYLWKSAKKRARDKELDFDIEVSDIIIPQLCPLLNIPLVVRTGHNHRSPDAPSLDRLDSRLGYTKGNILVISWRANFIKGDAALNELELLVANLRTISKLT